MGDMPKPATIYWSYFVTIGRTDMHKLNQREILSRSVEQRLHLFLLLQGLHTNTKKCGA